MPMSVSNMVSLLGVEWFDGGVVGVHIDGVVDVGELVVTLLLTSWADLVV